MAERSVVLDTPVVQDEQALQLQQARERAEHAEAELARLKAAPAESSSPAAEPAEGELFPDGNASTDAAPAHEPSKIAGARVKTSSVDEEKTPASPSTAGETPQVAGGDPIAALRNDAMMAHLLDSLEAGKDIGHYGRLVFAMIARHFLPEDQLIAWLMKDKDFSAEQARLMVHQVEGRDYSPPRRDRILEWQAQQDFPIIPDPADPDSGNIYKTLVFPEAIYEHIGHYREDKEEAAS